MYTGSKILQKWSVAFRTIPIILIVTVLKFISHTAGYEIMELNALFSSLIAGTIFLIGFLISGVLTDYKESERMPAEIAALLRNIHDDTITYYKAKKSPAADKFLKFQMLFAGLLKNWFYKKENMARVHSMISEMNDHFVEFEKEGLQANYIIRMKNDQSGLRRLLMRADTIRETTFIGSAYAIVESMGFLTACGLLVMKIEPFYVSLFLTLLITFLISYMLYLLKDLDNPFDYAANGEAGTEISLKPLHDFEREIKESEGRTE